MGSEHWLCINEVICGGFVIAKANLRVWPGFIADRKFPQTILAGIALR